MATWLQQRWYAQAPPPALLPLAAVFGGAVALRRLAYAHGWKRAERLPVPVIVVGNLSVGGTGKTPLTIWLAAFLRAAGYRPGIISRGYGGRALSQPLAVTADSDPATAGDEPVLLAQRTGCPVFVFPRRAEAGRALLAASDCTVLIADDGLQHYALARDIEIAVIDGERRFGNGACLPAGPLREPVRRLDTVDLRVCRGGMAQAGEYSMQVALGDAVNLRDGQRTQPLAAFAVTGTPQAVAAIGYPQRFFAALQAAGVDCPAQGFADHHPFTAEELRFPAATAILMTEKDAVKCRAFADDRYWAVPLQAHLPAAFGEALLQLLQSKVKHDG